MRRSTSLRAAVAAGAALSLAVSGPALADTVEMGDSGLPMLAGTTKSIQVQLVEESGNGQSTETAGCNAAPGAEVIVTLSGYASWLTVSPSVLTFTSCGAPQNVEVTVADRNVDANTVVDGVATGGKAPETVVTTTVNPGNGKITTSSTTYTSGYKTDFVNVNVSADSDGDGVANAADNCEDVANPSQDDADSDGIGDACEAPDVIVVTPADGDSDGVADATDNCPAVSNAGQADDDEDGRGDACDGNAFAPVVSDQALAADGFEGGQLITSGGFTDADQDAELVLTKGANDAGALVNNGDGTFSWSHSSVDDAAGSVTVTADDGEHTNTQTFSWTAENVAPVITGTTAAFTGPCAVTVKATAIDAGTADVLTTTIAWDDGSTALSRTFAEGGTYNAAVTVTDDDGGYDTEAIDTLTAKNTPSSILAPINTTGTRSSFKIGSTVPVKITVKDCGGQVVNSLTPQVNLVVGDATPDFPVNETVYADSATNGKLMRWSDTQYIYNLSTKQSQFTGGALGQGTYTVAVNDASFFAPVKATFDLRN